MTITIRHMEGNLRGLFTFQPIIHEFGSGMVIRARTISAILLGHSSRKLSTARLDSWDPIGCWPRPGNASWKEISAIETEEIRNCLKSNQQFSYYSFAAAAAAHVNYVLDYLMAFKLSNHYGWMQAVCLIDWPRLKDSWSAMQECVDRVCAVGYCSVPGNLF